MNCTSWPGTCRFNAQVHLTPYLLLRHDSATACAVGVLHCGQHRGGLLAAHDADARVGPHVEEARAVSTATHAVVASAKAAANEDCHLGHGRVGHSHHLVGCVEVCVGQCIAGRLFREPSRYPSLSRSTLYSSPRLAHLTRDSLSLSDCCAPPTRPSHTPLVPSWRHPWQCLQSHTCGQP